MSVTRRELFTLAAVAGSTFIAPSFAFAKAEAKPGKEPAYVFGHKNPDTDTIIGAMAAAHLYQARGMNVVAVAQGKVNPETEFVLKRFNLKAPEIITSVAGKDVFLVDFAERGQAPKDIDQANLRGIVDHHKLGDVTSAYPLECWIQPLGSACTILKLMYDYYGVAIPKDLAGGMLCAVLSDTVIFKSPTCTDIDRKVAKDLAKIAGVKNIEQLGLDMFKAKSNLNDSPRNLILRDYKEYDMGGKKVGIGQLELVSLAMVGDDLKAALKKELAALQKEGRHTVILLLTDIMQKGTELLYASADEATVLKALKVKKPNMWMPGVMSRKKQIVPPLQLAFK